MPYSIGVIGLGQIAKAILLPLFKSGDLAPSNVIAVVRKKTSVERALKELPEGIKIVSKDDPHACEAWYSPNQLLAVKPNQLKEVESQYRHLGLSQVSNNQLLISLLAGVTLKRLKKAFPQHACARTVPNTPVLVAEGLTGISFDDDLSDTQKSYVEKLFKPISDVLELPEEQLDPFLALTSSGPAYIALLAEALGDGAVAAGLPRQLADYLTPKMIAGSALLLQKEDFHPARLKNMVSSPGGTTITALRHLEKSGFRSALIEAVLAASYRSKELSKSS